MSATLLFAAHRVPFGPARGARKQSRQSIARKTMPRGGSRLLPSPHGKVLNVPSQVFCVQGEVASGAGGIDEVLDGARVEPGKTTANQPQGTQGTQGTA